MTQTILHIDTSARHKESVSRALSERVVARFDAPTVVYRDLSGGVPLIDEGWIAGAYTPDADRTPAQRDSLALSDTLIAELKAADTVVIGLPMYNFGIPASLKGWIDQVARVGVTFRYSEAGPEGLLTGKRAIIAVATGGTALGSDIDFVSDYLRHFLKFIGITDVTFVAADQLGADADAAIATAHASIDALSIAA